MTTERQGKVIYPLSDQLKKPSLGLELFEKYRDAILRLDPDISVKEKKFEMGFIKADRIVIDASIFKKYIKIWLNIKMGTLHDPKGIGQDVSGKGHWGNGDYEIKISDNKHFKYIIGLIKQAIK